MPIRSQASEYYKGNWKVQRLDGEQINDNPSTSAEHYHV